MLKDVEMAVQKIGLNNIMQQDRTMRYPSLYVWGQACHGITELCGNAAKQFKNYDYKISAGIYLHKNKNKLQA